MFWKFVYPADFLLEPHTHMNGPHSLKAFQRDACLVDSMYLTLKASKNVFFKSDQRDVMFA